MNWFTTRDYLETTWLISRVGRHPLRPLPLATGHLFWKQLGSIEAAQTGLTSDRLSGQTLSWLTNIQSWVILTAGSRWASPEQVIIFIPFPYRTSTLLLPTISSGHSTLDCQNVSYASFQSWLWWWVISGGFSCWSVRAATNFSWDAARGHLNRTLQF